MVIVIARIHDPGKGKLPRIVHAGDAESFLLRFGKNGQEHSRENRDNGDDEEQFDKSEAAAKNRWWILPLKILCFHYWWRLYESNPR